jgi:hypothetical protein
VLPGRVRKLGKVIRYDRVRVWSGKDQGKVIRLGKRSDKVGLT